jgi:hypothetical protein
MPFLSRVTLAIFCLGAVTGRLLAAVALTDAVAGTKAFTLPADLGPAPDLSRMVVFADSEDSPAEDDPEVYGPLRPDVVLRAWYADKGDLSKREDYNQEFRDACREAGILFIAGFDLTDLAQNQAAGAAEFDDLTTRDSQGLTVPHPEWKTAKRNLEDWQKRATAGAVRGQKPAGSERDIEMRRAAILNPKVAARALGILESQLDMGADGVFLGCADAQGYRGARAQGYDGDEGYDDYMTAEFNRYLLDRYPNYVEADWEIAFHMSLDNALSQWTPWNDLETNFNYRRYLDTNDWTKDPRARKAAPGLGNPLAREWGDHPFPFPVGRDSDGAFLDRALDYGRRRIALKLKEFARNNLDRRVVVSGDTLSPGFDLIQYPLRRDNLDVATGKVDYLPRVSGDLDASRSFLDDFRGLAARARAASPGAPLVLCLSLDKDNYADDYADLEQEQKRDYWRVYPAEALAAGCFMALHLRLAENQQPSAAAWGVLDTLVALSRFYRENRDLLTGVTDRGRGAAIAEGEASVGALEQDRWKRTIVHVINHAYHRGSMAKRKDLTLELAADTAPMAVHLKSPDFAGTRAVAYHFATGRVEITLPELDYEDLLVVKWPLPGPRRPADDLKPMPSPTPAPTLPPAFAPKNLGTPEATPPKLATPEKIFEPVAVPSLRGGFGVGTPSVSTPKYVPTPAGSPSAVPSLAATLVATPKAVGTPCVPEKVQVSRKIWVPSVLGEDRNLAGIHGARLGRADGDRGEYDLSFALTATARVWAEVDVEAGLNRADSNGAPEVFLDDQYLGLLLAEQDGRWRSPQAFELPAGTHTLSVRAADGENVPSVRLRRVQALSDGQGHWASETVTRTCGCGTPCPKDKP